MKAYLTNGAAITGYQHKNKNRSVSITMNRTQVQMDQRPQHKANHTEPHRGESR